MFVEKECKKREKAGERMKETRKAAKETAKRGTIEKKTEQRKLPSKRQRRLQRKLPSKRIVPNKVVSIVQVVVMLEIHLEKECVEKVRLYLRTNV